MEHMIRTQRIDLTSDNLAGAFDLQQAVSERYSRSMLPVIEKTFDELSPGPDLLYIDKLELDLGQMSVSDWSKTDLPPEFRVRLYEQLKQEILRQRPRYKQGSALLSVVAQWLYYMEHGFLPWNLSKTDTEWYAKTLEGLRTDYQSINTLRALMSRDVIAIRRIVYSHEPIFLAQLVESLTAQKQEDLPRFIRLLYQILSQEKQASEMDQAWKQFSQLVWEKIFQFLCTAGSVASGGETIRKVVLLTLTREQQILLQGKQDLPETLMMLMTFVSDQLREPQRPEKEFLRKPIPEKTNDQTKQLLAEDGLFVSHAGLIILHPFLRQFFSILQLTEKDQFLSDSARQKAMGLLHFMATGKTSFEEHEIVMAKMLCGYGISDPMDKPSDFSENDLSEANGLLAEVIGQWTILKQTSLEALRETFLQRGAKMTMEKNGDMRLIMEQQALDVLLNHLPWGLTMIKFPWMTRLISIEWNKPG